MICDRAKPLLDRARASMYSRGTRVTHETHRAVPSSLLAEPILVDGDDFPEMQLQQHNKRERHYDDKVESVLHTWNPYACTRIIRKSAKTSLIPVPMKAKRRANTWGTIQSVAKKNPHTHNNKKNTNVTKNQSQDRSCRPSMAFIADFDNKSEGEAECTTFSANVKFYDITLGSMKLTSLLQALRWWKGRK